MGEPGDLNTGAFVIIPNKFNPNSYVWVRNGYGEKKWSLPGGGVRLGELVNEAALREAREETGLEIGRPLRPIAIASLLKKYGVVHLFLTIDWEGIPRADGKEILEIKFATLNEMPDDEAYRAQKKLAQIYEKVRINHVYPVYCTLGDPIVIKY